MKKFIFYLCILIFIVTTRCNKLSSKIQIGMLGFKFSNNVNYNNNSISKQAYSNKININNTQNSANNINKLLNRKQIYNKDLTKTENVQINLANSNIIDSNLYKNISIEASPTYQIGYFSDRKQRYSKCIVKESDLFYVVENKEKIKELLSNNNNNNNNISTNHSEFNKSIDIGKLMTGEYNTVPINNSITIPSRVIMNLYTITVYGGSSLGKLIDTFNLLRSEFIRDSKNQFCFYIKETIDDSINIYNNNNNNNNNYTNNIYNPHSVTKIGKFCLYGKYQKPQYLEEWNSQYNLFKHECQSTIHYSNINKIKFTPEEEAEINRRVELAKKEIMIEKEKTVISTLRQDNISKNQINVKKANEDIIKAVEKQINIDNLVENEELERERNEEEQIKKLIALEKLKRENAIQNIKQKEIENQYNVKNEEFALELKEIKDQAAIQIKNDRNKLLKKIMLMRNMSRRRNSKLMSELKSLRTKFNEELTDAYKKGNQNNCLNIFMDVSQSINVFDNKDSYTSNNLHNINNANIDINFKNYCTRMFKNDLNLYSKCISSTNKCESCCGFEFNDLYINDRYKCINEVCVKVSSGLKGKWIFEQKIS